MIFHGDARSLPLDDESVHCIVTSPPYGTSQDYEGYHDLPPWTWQYRFLTRMSTQEMFRVIVPGGRAWINIMPAVPRPETTARFDLAGMWKFYLTQAGFEWRDTVIWRQDAYDAQCGWGSWRRPSAPNLRGGYEVILCVYKPPYKRVPSDMHAQYTDPDPDWQDLCRNIWSMRPVRRTKGSPASFPRELPERCIRLSTYPGEIVLDPFAGAGVTVEVAEVLGRLGLGFDIGAPEDRVWQPS